MIRVIYNDADITGIVTACSVEKNISAAGMQATVTVICSPPDRYLPRINPVCGRRVDVELNGERVFRGTVERVAFSSDTLSIVIVCFDIASRLAKNEVYAALTGTADGITKTVCRLAGLPAGTIYEKSGKLFIPPSTGLTALAAIKKAYGGNCVIDAVDGRVCVSQPRRKVVALKSALLLGVTAEDSAENIVNSVEVIGYKGRTDAVANDSASIAAYGLRRRYMSLQGARGTAVTTAKSGIVSPVTRAAATVAGNTAVTCGAIAVFDAAAWGLSGEYMVASVRHNVSDGVFTTEIGMVR